MNKKNIIGIIVIFIIVGGVVFFMNNNTNDEERNTAETRAQRERNTPFAFSNATPATTVDLTLGEHITVIGTLNSDGSITSQSILIGVIDIDATQFRRDTLEEQGESDRENFGERQLPEGFDREEFQNLSQAERRARFQELRASGEFQGDGSGQEGTRQSRFQDGTTMIRGEILDIDTVTITVALSEGGSRLVLYSDQTTISKLAEL